MRPLLAALITLAVLAPTASAAQRPTYNQLKRQVHALKVKNTALRSQVASRGRAIYSLSSRVTTLQTANATLITDKAALTTQVNSANTQVTSLTGENTRVTSENARIASENTGLKGSVPDQVAAIARTGVSADLQQFVLIPAHIAWACGGSVFYGQTFFSFDFDRRASDGYCY